MKLQQHKLYLPFIIVYNAGVGIMCTMLFVRGIFDVVGGNPSNGVISGIAGLGHVLVAAGIVLFFCLLLLTVRSAEKDAAQTQTRHAEDPAEDAGPQNSKDDKPNN